MPAPSEAELSGISTDFNASDINSSVAGGRKFLWTFCLLLLALLALPFVLMYTGLNIYLTSDVGLPRLDYPFSATTPSADIVFYGDSTCYFGIDPRLVSQQLHTSAVNICESGPVLANLGNYPLDYYLRTHARPKLISLALSPHNAVSPQSTELFSSFYLIFRHGALAQAQRLLPKFPFEPFKVWSNLLDDVTVHTGLPHQPSLQAQTEIQQGLGWNGIYTGKPMRSCLANPDWTPAPPGAPSYVQNFLTEYRSRGYQVAVFFTPLPDCDRFINQYKQSLRGLASNEPFPLERSKFFDDKYASHPFASTVPEVSARVSASLKPLLSLKPLSN